MAVVVLGTAIFGYWYLLDGWFNPVLVFNNDPLAYETDKVEYAPGETVQIYVDFCKKRPARAESVWVLTDTVVLFYPVKANDVPPGCYEGWFDAVQIPPLAQPGVYTLSGTTKYHTNPVNPLEYHYATNQFYVTDEQTD